MKHILLLMVVCVLSASVVIGQPARTDVKWARTTTETMVIDGQMNEASWASAESTLIRYGVDNGMPGSGWFKENGLTSPTDSTWAMVKYLVKADSLYVGVRILDKSVGGGDFNRFDGILSNIRRREQTNRPTGAGEIFYSWWNGPDTLAATPGRMPNFAGPWGSSPYEPRPDSLSVTTWFAATTVQGTQNDDSNVDVGYTNEFRINLRSRGYDVMQSTGDIIQYSLSIYDADYQWPLDTTRQAGNRAWFQCPWGNNNAYGHIRLYSRPDVTIASGPVPSVSYELRVPGSTYPNITFDGRLTEGVWQNPSVGTLQIQFGNSTIRNGYPSTAPYRSGQFQPNVNGGQAAVVDPSLATVKYFYKEDTLFVGLDVADLVVQDGGTPEDRWDGFRLSINDRGTRDGSNVLFPRALTFSIGGSGTSLIVNRREDLAPDPGAWDSAGTKVQIAVALKGGTTIDTLGATPDSGYSAEYRINLRELGYPAGRGDGVLFFGATFYDGDSFTPASASYGTRTWFMRERAGSDSPIWAYMDPSGPLSVDKDGNSIPEVFTLIGNFPNPFNPSTTIKFVMPQRSDVTLEVFNILGQLVASRSFADREAGEHSVNFNASNLASGIYNYRLRMVATDETVVGKMVLLK